MEPGMDTNLFLSSTTSKDTNTRRSRRFWDVRSGIPNLSFSRRAADQLPDGYKQVFTDHDVQDYEHQEIAKILGCSVGNSKSQLFKARCRLRVLLQEALRTRAREKREAVRISVVQHKREKNF